PVPLRKIFDYLPATDTVLSALQPGMRVRVPFGRRELVGIFLELASESECDPKKLRPIEAVLDEQPILPPEILKLCRWAAEYYHYPLGEVFAVALPARLRQGKPAWVK